MKPRSSVTTPISSSETMVPRWSRLRSGAVTALRIGVPEPLAPFAREAGSSTTRSQRVQTDIAAHDSHVRLEDRIMAGMSRRAQRQREGNSAAVRDIAAQLRLAAAMQREGMMLMRENLRRRHPTSTAAELNALFEQWLLDRAPDAPGRRVPWPRKRRRRAA
jgi:hypothetical protein